MPPTPNIDTLQKLEFSTMDQFLDALNRNFAVIQNSPLYKGVPGNEGEEGGTGLTGTRGGTFIFVELAPFQTQFPGELQAASDITLVYLNSKVSNFDSMQKLQAALGVTELVDKDVVVLSNTQMLSYGFVANIFTDTGMAFNTQTSLQNSIEAQIEAYVQYYIENSSSIANIKNIYTDYATYGKNYPDTNNTYTTTSITGSTVYSPYIPGFNSQIGVPVTNHKYFGFTDSEFPLANAGTSVFGSMKQYYNMLMATVSTDGNNTLNSAFAPGVNNVPAAVFLQDTWNNGLMVGYKGSPNLRAFATIYKNDVGEMVLQSDQGSQASEYSQLLIHATYMRYAKLVQFLNDFQLTGDITVGGDFDTKPIHTGKYTAGAGSGNNYNSGVTEVGVFANGSVTKQVAQTEQWPNYPTAVLVTDSAGTVKKNIVLETTTMIPAEEIDLAQITQFPNSPTSVITSNYYAFLATKINNITAYASSNYWRKDQFGTGVIPGIAVSGVMSSGGDTSLAGGMVAMVKNTNIMTITTQQTVDNAVTKKYGFFKGKVFVTDANGNLSTQYSLDAQVLDPAEVANGPLAIYSASNQTLITTYHYAHLAQRINAASASLTSNYWSKTDFDSGAIPNLHLSGDLSAGGTVDFTPSGLGTSVFHIDKNTGVLTVGSNTSEVDIISNNVKFTKFVNNVLVTDGSGKLVSTYSVETAQYATGDQVGNNPITVNVNSGAKLPTSANLGWIATKLNNFMAWVSANFWTRTQMSDGSVSDIRATNSIKSDNILQAGTPSDPTLAANGAVATVGKSNGTTNIRGSVINVANMPSKVLVTDASGNLVSTYSIEGSRPAHLDQTGITTNYWASGASTFDTVPNSSAKILTSDLFDFVMKNFNSVRALIFDRPTYAELNTLMPSGGIIMWTNKMGGVPSNWTICDGRIIPGTGIASDNMINAFVKGSLTPGVSGGNSSNSVVIAKANLPNVGLNVTVSSAGDHTHTESSAGDHNHSYTETQTGTDFGSGSTRSSWTQATGGTTGNAGAHTHSINNAGVHTHSATTDAMGSGTAMSIEPNSYTVIFIIKN
jgi:hypothetical protein